MTEGWGFPVNSRVHHYFVDKQSLCGKWFYGGEVFREHDDDPDNCAECKRRLVKRRERDD